MMWGFCLKATVDDHGWWDRSKTNERLVWRDLVLGLRLPVSSGTRKVSWGPPTGHLETLQHYTGIPLKGNSKKKPASYIE